MLYDAQAQGPSYSTYTTQCIASRSVCRAMCVSVRAMRTRLLRRIYARAPTTAGTHAPHDLPNTRAPHHSLWPCDTATRHKHHSNDKPLTSTMCQWLNQWLLSEVTLPLVICAEEVNDKWYSISVAASTVNSKCKIYIVFYERLV